MPNASTTDKQAYTIAEFCAAYSVKPTFTYAQIGRGKLLARKAGRRTIIFRDDAEAWANSLPTTKARASE